MPIFTLRGQVSTLADCIFEIKDRLAMSDEEILAFLRCKSDEDQNSLQQALWLPANFTIDPLTITLRDDGYWLTRNEEGYLAFDKQIELRTVRMEQAKASAQPYPWNVPGAFEINATQAEALERMLAVMNIVLSR